MLNKQKILQKTLSDNFINAKIKTNLYTKDILLEIVIKRLPFCNYLFKFFNLESTKSL